MAVLFLVGLVFVVFSVYCWVFTVGLLCCAASDFCDILWLLVLAGLRLVV